MAFENSTKILVVDDEPDTPLLFNQKFRNEISSGKYAFSFCRDGETAIKIIKNKENDIDIMIVDINIPGMDWIELINEVGKTNNIISSIVISTYGNIGLIRSAMRAGAHDFLIKPTDFNDLSGTLSKASIMVKERKKSIENYQRLSVITDELDVSAKLQRSILPGNVLKKGGVEIYADTIPAAEVGGDFYDFFFLNETQLGIVMADVSGKNVSAAMFMTMARTLLKSFAMFAESPADCLKRVNLELMRENSSTMFVTAMYGIIDITTHMLTYTNAGHLPIALIHPRKNAVFLECDPGIALGIVDSVEFQNNTHKLTPGDTILLYTDGVPEATDDDGNEYDYDRFEKFLNENKAKNPADLTSSLIDSIKKFTKGAAQSDDITTLCLKYRIKVGEYDV